MMTRTTTMMMMDEFTLSWREVLELQGHVTVMEESRSSHCSYNVHKSEWAVRLSKKLGLQSTAENWQWRRCPYWLRQTVPNTCSSRQESTIANGSSWGAWSNERWLLKIAIVDVCWGLRHAAVLMPGSRVHISRNITFSGMDSMSLVRNAQNRIAILDENLNRLFTVSDNFKLTLNPPLHLLMGSCFQ